MANFGAISPQLSKNIKELRIEKGLSPAGLAEAVGVSQGAVYFWEKGINEPTAGYLVKMADLFNVSVDELLSYKKTKDTTTFTKLTEMASIFPYLTSVQKDIIIAIAKEFIKNI